MGNPKGVKRDAEQFALLERRRIKAAKLFDQGLSQAAVARQLGVHRQSVSRWHSAWQNHGVRALKRAGRAGRRPGLTAANFRQLERALKQGPEAHDFGTQLWTTRRVATVIQRLTGVQYHPDHVGRLLQKLGWSCQRPTTQARQRNEPEIARWRKIRWPQLKKSPARAADRGVHRRERLEPEAAPGAHVGSARPDPRLGVLAQLSDFGRKALGRMRRRPKLVAAFWKQAELW